MLTSKTQEEIWETINRIKNTILVPHISNQFKNMDNVSEYLHNIKKNGIPLTVTSASPMEILFDSVLQGYTDYLLTSAIPEYNSQGSSTFINLTDTPLSYDGQSGKIVAVKSDQTGLEFVNASFSTENYIDGGFAACQYLDIQVVDAGGA